MTTPHNQHPDVLSPDPYFPSGRRVILLDYFITCSIPYTNYLDFRKSRRVTVYDFGAAEVWESRTGNRRTMTAAEIERFERAERVNYTARRIA